MSVSSTRIAVATAAAFVLLSAPASAGGLFGSDCGCCSCAAPVAVEPAPTVSVRYGVRPVTSIVARDYYVRQRTYVPVTTYVPQPYYVVDRGPSYNVTPVSYATPSVSYTPGRYITHWQPGYHRRHYGYRGYYSGGYRWGGYRRAYRGYHHRTFYGPRFGYRHAYHGGHRFHHHGFRGHRHSFHGGWARPHAFHGRHVHRAPALAGGPGRHGGARHRR